MRGPYGSPLGGFYGCSAIPTLQRSPVSVLWGTMNTATALAVVPDNEDSTSPDTEAARKSDRQQVSLARGLRDLVTAERDRIEAALPEHRRRSIEHYSDLVVRLGLRELEKVQPVVDPLAALGL